MAIKKGATQPSESVQPTEATAETQPAEVTVTDLVGRSVTVTPGSYKRVVCIGAGALRMYTYVADVSLLCGVEDIDNTALSQRPAMFDSVARPYLLAHEAHFQTLPSCGVGGPMAQAAEAEKILSCMPDIVISEFEDADKSNALQEQLGVPVITLVSGPNGVFDESFAASLELLGTIFGEEERVASLLDFIGAETAEIRQRTANIPEADKPSVYICGLGNWGTTDHLMTSEAYAPFQIANIKNVVTGLGAPGVQPIEAEKFAALGEQIDIMIIDTAALKNIQPAYNADRGLFTGCKAWETGEVYLQMAYNAYYTNYEIMLINTWFAAKTAYPELFADIDMTEKTNQVTEAFLGVALADEIFARNQGIDGYAKLDAAHFVGA